MNDFAQRMRTQVTPGSFRCGTQATRAFFYIGCTPGSFRCGTHATRAFFYIGQLLCFQV